MSRTTNGAADACDRRSRTYPLTLLPVRRADEAFPKTENIAIMTAEICAVQPSSGALYSRRTSPAPAACLRSPPPIRRAPNRSRQRHRNITLGIPIANYGKLCSLPMVRRRHPHYPRARGTLARSTCHRRRAPRTQTSTEAHLSTRLSGRRKRQHAQTAADCRRLPLPRSSSRRLALLPCRRQLKTIPGAITLYDPCTSGYAEQ